jgi:hypothetical protein
MPELVRFGFPELREVDIISEFADLDGLFTDHEYDFEVRRRRDCGGSQRYHVSGMHNLRLCKELSGAPMPVVAGAIATELQQIAKDERSFLLNMWDGLLEKVSVTYQIWVSQREDVDIIRRGLGYHVSEFNRFITENCGYVWTPLDGYSPFAFETMVTMHNQLERCRRYQ